MQAKEYIFNNIEILNNIFQYVNYHEQLILTSVCSTFKDVIVNHIWKLKYKELEVIRAKKYYILTNRINHISLDFEMLKHSRIILSENEFDEFLNINANNVQILKLLLTHQLEDKKPTTHFNIKYKMTNLISLTFVDEIITDQSFDMLSSFCPQLETLCLEFCRSSESQGIIFGKDIKVENIQNIKTLKSLEVYDTSYNFLDEHHHRCSDIVEILVKLKLLQLILRVTIIPEENNDDCRLLKEYEDIYPCKVLKLGPFHKTSCFTKFRKRCLNDFQNLTSLTIVGRELYPIEDMDFFDTLSTSCNSLIYLELDSFTITNFAAPKTLNELVLHFCRGLTCKDLENILSDFKLKRFSSTGTEYAGTMTNDVTASKTLEYLKFDNQQLGQLCEMKGFNGFENLTFLKYDNCKVVLKHFSTQCPNLRKLYMKEYAVAINDLYKLKSLEKCEIEYVIYKDLPNILLILKHSSVTHIVVKRFQDIGIPFKYEESMDLRTNLLLIDIPYNLFKLLQDVWLDLVNLNPRLHLLIRYYPMEFISNSFLKSVITHTKFPKRLKTIKVCGFDIDCQDLRDEFDATLCNISKLDTYLDFSQFYILL